MTTLAIAGQCDERHERPAYDVLAAEMTQRQLEKPTLNIGR